MKRTIIVLMFLLLSGLSVHSFAKNADWLDNFEKAKKIAQEKNIPILMNFSGSDWCVWCKKLNSEVLSKDVFINYANDQLVLFVADFPRTKTLPRDIQDQNQILAEKYGVRGLPTVLLVDPEGNVLARTGYQQGGPESYVKHLKSLLKENAMTSAEDNKKGKE